MTEPDIAQRIRALADAAALPDQLDYWPTAAIKLRRARQLRISRRIVAGAAIVVGVAVVSIAIVIVTPSGHQGASAAVIVHRAAAVLQGGSGLPPLDLTEVTRTVPGFEPERPPRQVVEHIQFAAPDEWRDTATIALSSGHGSMKVTTIRDGGRLATVSGNQVNVVPASGQNGSLFETSVVGERLAWSAVQAAMGTGRCARSLTENTHGPVIAGQATLVVNVGPARCPSEAAPETDGPATLWLSARSYLVLKAVLHGPAGQLAGTVQVTALRYNPAFPVGTFTLPRARPSPTPSASGPGSQPGALTTLAALRRALAYRPLLPNRLPGGLHVGKIAALATAGGKVTKFTVTFDNAAGSPIVQLYEAPNNSPSVHFSGHAVVIRPGLTGTVSNIEGLILWWIQDGRYCSLQTGGTTAGVNLGTVTQRTLVQMAASFI